MPVPQTPTSVDPGPAGSFKWKGLNWNTVSYQGGPASNFVRNADGTVTFKMTSAGGCHIVATKGGLGYGDYYIVTDTDLAALPAGVVWGGHFPYDNSDGSQEMDNQESSTWGGSRVTMSPHHWRNPSTQGEVRAVANGGSGPQSNPFPVPSGGPWCNVTKWRQGRIDYFIYRALEPDPSKLYWSGSSTTGVPVPKTSTVQHINLWNGPKACQVHVVDFSFVPVGSTPAPPPPPPPATGKKVTIGSSSYPLAGTDIRRETDALVVYTDNAVVTSTNVYGAEAAVANGKVTVLEDRMSDNGGGVPIPRGGYVLSGHGAARDWVLANAKVGATVTGDVPGSGAPPIPPATEDYIATSANVTEKHNLLVKALKTLGIIPT